MKGALLLIWAALSASCRQEPIEVRRVPKETAPAMASLSQPSGLRWTAPPGWKELPASGMRAATFEPPPGAGAAEITVVSLPGDVGGELANVNRWRGQIGLTPIDEAALAGARERLQSRAGTISVYDFAGRKSRLVAGMLSLNGTTWFFKLTGEEKAVGAAKPAFLKLLKGLKSDAA